MIQDSVLAKTKTKYVDFKFTSPDNWLLAILNQPHFFSFTRQIKYVKEYKSDFHQDTNTFLHQKQEFHILWCKINNIHLHHFITCCNLCGPTLSTNLCFSHMGCMCIQGGTSYKNISSAQNNRNSAQHRVSCRRPLPWSLCREPSHPPPVGENGFDKIG